MSTDEQLLAFIDTPEKYQQFKRFWSAGKVTKSTRTGPFYQGLPARVNPLDRYDPDRLVLSLDGETRRLYCQFLHGVLSRQLDVGTTMPRYRDAKDLDRFSIASFFAATAPRLSLPLEESCVARWDRNASALYPMRERPLAVKETDLHWRDRAFQELVPLYRDYYAEGENTIANDTGVPLDRNTLTIARYLIEFFRSANDYRKKLREVAETVLAQNQLTDARQKLINELVVLQREKQAQINVTLAQERTLSVNHREILRRFNSAYQQAINQLSQASTTKRARR